MKATYTGLSGILADTTRAYSQAIRGPLPEIMHDQAAKLSCSDFGDGKVGLFQEAAAIAPTMKELFALPAKLHWHIKRRGRPVLTMFTETVYKRGKKKGQKREVRARRADGEKILAGEIQRRMAARLYQATGWLSHVLDAEVKSGRLKKQASGIVEFKLEGDVMIVSITNPRKNSAEVNMAHGNYVQRAIDNRVIDMLEYIERHKDRVAVEFNSGRLTRAA